MIQQQRQDLFSGAEPLPDQHAPDHPFLILPRLPGGDCALIPLSDDLRSPHGNGQAVGEPPACTTLSTLNDHVETAVQAGGLPAEFLSLPGCEPSTSGAIGLRITPGGSLEAVLQARLRQIQQYGHTPEKDAAAPLRKFTEVLHAGAVRIANETKSAVEDEMFDVGLDVLRNRLAAIAAMAMAAIDRVDVELERQDAEDPFIPREGE